MDLSLTSSPLQTPRLDLRAFHAADFPAYAAYHGDPQVYRFLYMAAPQGDRLHKQFAEVLSEPFAGEGDTWRQAVVRREDGVLVGEFLLKIASTAALQLEVGYIFNPHHAGRGYATEAVAALLEHGFEHIGAHRIFARLDARNTGSARVAERLGMRREAHLVQNDRFEGEWGDEFIYALLRAEWKARHGVPRP
ncbi:GCN5-related N-acetyltransferase [Paracidovorax avenae ATCC 19860]|uniref:GCN5-related N-acetyltransferase n=1 Tax=Paracidovorax avenae (strain ATCC 19860 / DSM 7227 / CCUG 15838 / JCM 20985 / LMG 2117 / NCPPB 1011) TaxID=643561 RepID=F0Q2U5_PARA1|nr:GNAT family protein [Paracidovorax avenae]ADX44204.1 GCN5-related N-acetyltransferase [Paracidovorax avenae ATCC 19860]